MHLSKSPSPNLFAQDQPLPGELTATVVGKQVDLEKGEGRRRSRGRRGRSRCRSRNEKRCRERSTMSAGAGDWEDIGAAPAVLGRPSLESLY